MIDYHVHESHSRDAPGATVEAYVRAAEGTGIEEVAFTTHLIIAGPDQDVGIRIGEIPGYVEGIREAQETTKVRLRVGLEVDYFPEEERRLERIVGEHDLDFVLGSTHYINGVDIGQRDQARQFFTGRPVEEAVDEYYEVWGLAVGSGLFDVMAHPDYFRKYVHLFREPIKWAEFGEAVYGAIDSLVEHDVGIEVNTSGYKHGMGGFFPLGEFLEAAYEAGVKKVTVGSDSHEVGTLGFRLGEAVRSLERAGFGTISLFEGRRNHSVPIERV